MKVSFGFLAAVVTSRVLGPGGKGTLSTLLLLGVLLSYACSLGLGDAAVFFVKQKRADVSAALSTSIPLALIASVVGIGVLWSAAWIADWSKITGAVVLASAFLPIATLGYLLASFEEAAERLVVTSTVSALAAVVAGLGTAVFVGVLDLDIFGGILAATVAGSFSVIALLVTLRSQGVKARPLIDLAYLKQALPYGLVVEASYLLMAITSRADLLVVYAVLGDTEAGFFAVALTLGELVAYAPDAVSAAAFPRLAGLPSDEVATLGPRIFRVSLASAVVGALVLTICIPLVIRYAFGPRFLDATISAIILAWGGVFWSAQWTLARMAAARGLIRIYFACFASSATLMMVLDLLLIARLGIVGAAVIAAFSSLFGFLLAAFLLRDRLGFSLSPKALRPRFEDFQELMTVLGLKSQ